MRIEYEKPDVLEDMERVVILYYRKHKTTTDYDALTVYEDLLDDYTKESNDRPAKAHKHNPAEAAIYAELRVVCEIWLGRGESDRDVAEGIRQHPQYPIDLPTILACLKRLIKSVKFWTKQAGRQGYLNFVNEHIN